MDLTAIRGQFPAFTRKVNGNPAAYFDGPAGSQVPRSVADAVSKSLLHCNANCGAPFATSRESDAILHGAHSAMADFFGTPDADCIAFGANMTSLTFALSRALARTWKPGDEVIVTRLDHDANVTPWVLAARDAGVAVRHVDVNLEDGTLDRDDFAAKLSAQTKLVAVGYASNITGSVNPVKEMTAAAHAVGAKVFIDAVHYAPHRSIDVDDIGCDFLCASAYKFFGPHVGAMYGKRELLESLTPYKLRPSPNRLPGRWMTGTQNHEGIAGVAAAVDYLAGLSALPESEPRGRRLADAFERIRSHEESLLRTLLAGLAELPRYRVWGIADLNRFEERVPTVSVTHEHTTPQEIAANLAEQGIFTWPGNHYALPFTEAAGLEPNGTLRIGLLHYNTEEEVSRVLSALAGY